MSENVYAWGNNESGQLGIGTNEAHYSPAFLPSSHELNIVRVYAKANRSFFLTSMLPISFPAHQ